ncbi:MAG: carbamoyl-phosphate synthase large subunit [Akkermansiaceae bacterium]|jgi:carbamoyl-phosphate synthase large subunit|nr:carbamoyl-phosphate synthase large subunit [Akkermansiaceae bacterium]MDP4647565.1 carbamoyl-phosphate synthase large subunit [Akkermansiaceae bacterium]MDP4720724.1 carbamoyl-phosphate synthase large subunit [Akkermansiaceae bacterium]MDP4779127.1 carbamoyl-phosphate synthase large subunit [Akkermansiaceae bacterium]MDP4847248.1 carbamoyl-phosphate synthase large subunit [Akkermansiaceae bacterium]
MPKDTSIHKILVIGSGPIVIGQGCEFDYSGVQACKALKEEGYEVILVNSNPATIMTDPEFAHRTYIEPITPEVVEKIIIREKPDALLPTLGGQTALNTSMSLFKAGILEKHGVKMIGANAEAIDKGEDRHLFKEAMEKIGLDMPRSGIARTKEEAREVAAEIGTFPLIVRPAFTLGGQGGGIAYNKEEFEEIVHRGLDLSPVSEVLIDESLLGWKEFEMEVMRDRADNCVVICSIENLDPMGVHTGDSITVAPIQTLTDREYQIMRDASFAVIREIGVETGGSNIQFATDPKTGRMIVIEMNPRVSRSSALASKATGFPIAKIAAKLAVGYTLDELPNDITQVTPASFEPTIDYVVTKIPRFTFEKFPTANEVLTTSMKSVGEAMSIGRTFKESMQKCLRSLETGRWGFGFDKGDPQSPTKDEITRKLQIPNCERIFWLQTAFVNGWTIDEIFDATNIDRWFLRHLEQIAKEGQNLATLDLKQAKKLGFSDRQIAKAKGTSEDEVRAERKAAGIIPTYRLVDTCAAEFEAFTPYFYSTYGDENEARQSDKKKIIILGGGPNRIGQGIEFDYCCVHAAFALKELGYETIMVNSNPETVSTDYDTSDKLFFEPLTLEDVLNICDQENPYGVIVQFGGQTPLNLAADLERHGVPIIGTSPKSIELAEDRKFFSALLDKLNLKQAEAGTATNEAEAIEIANRIGYPVLVRPSFVLGGRGMMIVYSDSELTRYMREAVIASPERPVLVDRFLDNATEVDVDCISDGETSVVGAIMEHIEQAGIHSGDSACVIPSFSLSDSIKAEITRAAIDLARELEVRGLMNIQFAVKDEQLYVIEVNPRASRTVPFVSKSTGVSLAKLAAKVMVGEKLADMGYTQTIVPSHFSVKEAVFPWNRFPGIDIVLGPEMKSTGEVMGIDTDWGMAYAKAQISAFNPLPKSGNVFLSVSDRDKDRAVNVARDLHELGFKIVSTGGTLAKLAEAGIPAERVYKVLEQARPNIIDMMKNNEIHFLINTPATHESRADEILIRSTAIAQKISYATNMAAAEATVKGMRSIKENELTVQSIQEYHA